MRTALLLLVLALSQGHVAAEEGKAKTPARWLTTAQAAEKTLAAVQSKDDAALKALAALRWPDAWLVADVLCARGKGQAALALATAARGGDAQRLREYVKAWRWTAEDPAAAAVMAAQKSGDWAAVLERSEVAVEKRSPVLAVQVRESRGRALRAQAKFTESRAAFQSAAEAAEDIGWLYGATQSHYAAGNCAFDAADYQAALTAWRRRLVIERQRGYVDDIAHTLMTIANAHQNLSHLEKAVALHQEALALIEGKRQDRLTAMILLNLGNVHFDGEAFERAREVQERALAIATRLELDRDRSLLLNNLGNTYSLLGAHDRALAVLEEALQLARKSGNVHGVARALHNLGSMHQQQGRYADALRCQEEALSVFEKLRDRHSVGWILGNLANTHELLGDLDRALELQQRARSIMEALGDRLGTARGLLNLGNLHYARGEHKEALAVEERALALAKALSHRGMQATLLGNMANSLQYLGQMDEALALQERALVLFRALKDDHHIAVTLLNIGTYHRMTGRHAEALPVLREAADAAGSSGSLLYEVLARGEIVLALDGLGETLDAVREARAVTGTALRLFSGLADEQGAHARSRVMFIMEAGARAASKLGDAEQLAYFLEAGRAGSLLEFLGQREAMHRAKVPAALRKQEVEVRAAEAKALAAYRRAHRSGNLKKIRTRKLEMEKTRQDVANVIARIQREAKAVSGVFYPQPAPLARVRSRLEPEEALVLYGMGQETAWAVVLTAAEARVVSLAESAAIATAVEALHAGERDGAVEDPTSELRALLVKPLGLPKGTARLLVSPDGPLGYVPFALLAPDLEIVHVPSGTTYDLLYAERALRGQGVLALGDPAYAYAADDPGVVRYGGGVRLARLPATSLEARAVGNELLLGSDATENGLRKALTGRARWRSVHLACHGFVNPENPGLCSLALVQEGDDDGFLTALDVFRLSIPADLVVLSACETGRGKIVRGEGIVGLTRAFMFAGTPRVLVSLWKVDDEATRTLMVKFYELWNPKNGKRGLGAAAALKQAQAFVRSHKKWRHPYYWAAWVLWGLPN